MNFIAFIDLYTFRREGEIDPAEPNKPGRGDGGWTQGKD